MNIRELEEQLSVYPEDTEIQFTYNGMVVFNHINHVPAEAGGTVCLELGNKGLNGVTDPRLAQQGFEIIGSVDYAVLKNLYVAVSRFRHCKLFESDAQTEAAETDLLESVCQATRTYLAASPKRPTPEGPCQPYRTLDKSPKPEETS